MPRDRFEVGVVIAKRRLNSRWASHAWLPHAVLPAAPSLAAGASLGGSPETELYYAGAYDILLYPSETGHSRDNLLSGRPSLWVALRPGEDCCEIGAVTANP